nr:target of rapamycin [Tanacetum cinerariifolium]
MYMGAAAPDVPYKCRAFAKALHYKEMEFEGALSKKMDMNPVAVVEALIHINNQLHQHKSIGMHINLSCSWNINLCSTASATGACFECGEVGHLAKDCKKGS